MNETMNHFDAAGNAVMVDVGGKILTERTAVASGKIFVGEEVYYAIESGTSKKGEVLGVARLAGIMAAKKTSDVIPLCPPLPLSHCALDFEMLEKNFAVKVIATVKTAWKTGVEMEALHAARLGLNKKAAAKAAILKINYKSATILTSILFKLKCNLQ